MACSFERMMRSRISVPNDCGAIVSPRYSYRSASIGFSREACRAG
jgi:hypothetical protein